MKSKRYFGCIILAAVSVLLLGCGGFGQKGGLDTTETFGPMPAEKLLGLAESRFKDGDYNSALRAYVEFEKAHPGSELMPYCIFGQGLCYFRNLEKPDRDQSATRRAMKQFQRVVARYPRWKYSADAERNIAECQRLLAEHEFYVAAFYQKTGRAKAALDRYQSIIRDYPGSAKAAAAEKGAAECRAEMAKAPRPKGFVAGLFDAQW